MTQQTSVVTPERFAQGCTYEQWMAAIDRNQARFVENYEGTHVSDEDARTYIRIFTLKTRTEIEALEAEQKKAPHLRALQKALAADVTERVHSQKEVDTVVEASEILFGKGTAESLKKLSEEDFLAVFEGVPQFPIISAELLKGIPVIDLLSEKAAIFKSKGEAKRMLQGGGVAINKNKVEENAVLTSADLLSGKYILAQKGKKEYFILICT